MVKKKTVNHESHKAIHMNKASQKKRKERTRNVSPIRPIERVDSIQTFVEPVETERDLKPTHARTRKNVGTPQRHLCLKRFGKKKQR